MSIAELVKGKRVVVVGPAPSIVGSKQREKIDGYDIVVRINKAIPVPETMQNDIGTRTTILYNCLNVCPGNGGVLDPKVLKKAGVVHVRCPYPARPPFLCDIKNAQKLDWQGIGLSWTDTSKYNAWEQGMESRPNSGHCAIMDLLLHDISELYITGFTFFKGGYYSAYRNLNEAQVHERMNKAGNHNQEKQLEYMRRLLCSDKRVVMDRALQEIVDGTVPLITCTTSAKVPRLCAVLRDKIPHHKQPFGDHVVQIVSLNSKRMQRCEESAKLNNVRVRRRPGIVPTRISKTELRVVHGGSTYTFIHSASCPSRMAEFGCFIAHLFAMKDTFADNPELHVAIIGEDDIMFDYAALMEHPLDTLLNKAPKDWEIINLLPSLMKDLKNVHNGLKTPFSDRHSHGTVLFAVKRHAAVPTQHRHMTSAFCTNCRAQELGA